MKCPTCNVDLVMSERQGIEIDYCPQCRGVWLDRGNSIRSSSGRLPRLQLHPRRHRPNLPLLLIPRLASLTDRRSTTIKATGIKNTVKSHFSRNCLIRPTGIKQQTGRAKTRPAHGGADFLVQDGVGGRRHSLQPDHTKGATETIITSRVSGRRSSTFCFQMGAYQNSRVLAFRPLVIFQLIIVFPIMGTVMAAF